MVIKFSPCPQVATTLLSADLYVSLSIVQPCMRGLLAEHLNVDLAEDPATIRSFKEVVGQDLRVRFCGVGATTSAGMVAALLDPRFKNLNFLGVGDDALVVKEEVFEEVQRLLQPLLLNQNDPVEPAPKRQKQALSGLDFILGSYPLQDEDVDMANDYGEAEHHEQQDEFAKFRGFVPIDGITNTTDPIKWWSDNAARFPTVSKLAQRYMCTPATSVPSERVFSAAGNIVNSKRSLLTPEHVNMLVFLSKITDNE